MRLQEFLYDNLPGKGLDKARLNRTAAHTIANELLETKTEALELGKSNRDVMSILGRPLSILVNLCFMFSPVCFTHIVRENAKETGESRLSRSEIIAQVRTIMLAGQETTSNTLSWALYELAKQPHIQTRLRAEVRAAEGSLRERGAADFTVADFEAMPYLQAVLKEVLRFYPVVPHTYRQPTHDDVLPLAKPLRTRSGKVITALPIRAGVRLILSVCAYNRYVECCDTWRRRLRADTWP